MYPPPPPPVLYAYVDPRRTSGLSVASLVLGIVGIATGCCSFGILSIVAVVLGHLGLHETRDNTVKGRGMAIAGMVMGYVLVAPSAVISVLWLIGTVTAPVTGVTPSSTPTY